MLLVFIMESSEGFFSMEDMSSVDTELGYPTNKRDFASLFRSALKREMERGGDSEVQKRGSLHKNSKRGRGMGTRIKARDIAIRGEIAMDAIAYFVLGLESYIGRKQRRAAFRRKSARRKQYKYWSKLNGGKRRKGKGKRNGFRYRFGRKFGAKYGRRLGLSVRIPPGIPPRRSLAPRSDPRQRVRATIQVRATPSLRAVPGVRTIARVRVERPMPATAVVVPAQERAYITSPGDTALPISYE